MIYTKPELSSNGYECFCLGIFADGFKTESEAWQWIVNKLTSFLDLYVDWEDPDSNLLKKQG
jgi:hypothetical protein